jgi:hypothetical protein
MRVSCLHIPMGGASVCCFGANGSIGVQFGIWRLDKSLRDADM